jgi:hypothetical protein
VMRNTMASIQVRSSSMREYIYICMYVLIMVMWHS